MLKSPRAVVIVGLAVVAALVVGCGSSSNGPVAVNWYVFPEPSGSFATAAADCSKASGGKYNIKINFLSTSSDQQRVSLVRRLAAKDPSIDILAMDVDWTARFATAKVDPSRAGDVGCADPHPRPCRASADCNLAEPGVNSSDQFEHRAAVVSEGPRAEPTQDVDRDDQRRRKARQGGQATPTSRSRAPSTRASRCGSTRWWRRPADRFSPPATESSSDHAQGDHRSEVDARSRVDSERGRRGCGRILVGARLVAEQRLDPEAFSG